MISISRIHFTLSHLPHILFFLIREIFSIEATSDNNDKIMDKCRALCRVTFSLIGILIIVGIIFVIFRIRKRSHHRQKTGHTEEIESVKCKRFKKKKKLRK